MSGLAYVACIVIAALAVPSEAHAQAPISADPISAGGLGPFRLGMTYPEFEDACLHAVSSAPSESQREWPHPIYECRGQGKTYEVSFRDGAAFYVRLTLSTTAPHAEELLRQLRDTYGDAAPAHRGWEWETKTRRFSFAFARMRDRTFAWATLRTTR